MISSTAEEKKNGVHRHHQRKSRNGGVSAGTSSEFLYLDILVNNSHSYSDDDANAINGSGGGEDGYVPKMGSPELRPLSPLSRRNVLGEVEEDEFHSPRRSSSGGKESVGANGFTSKPAFMAVEGMDNLGRE
ncbi:hypothetical protein Sjap_007717 [Stephania japonica]|uniref:Uncharacterized protein n=1 Tax=Stephania japonica TaxID=461633 RepID=A0AAP0PA71_9MAGN